MDNPPPRPPLDSEPMARPPKLTKAVQDKIVNAIGAGNYQDAAARYAGISETTYYRWMSEAREPGASKELREFRDAVEKARADAEARNVALIQNAAQNGTWQAAAWWLERSHPQKWGRINRTEISGPDGGPIETTVDIEALEEKLAAFFGLGEPDPA